MLKKLPRGAKRTSDWREVGSNCYPKGKGRNEVTLVMYEADMVYADGLAMTANMVEVYDEGNRVYAQAFYGETSRSDAMRLGMDAVDARLYAKS